MDFPGESHFNDLDSRINAGLKRFNGTISQVEIDLFQRIDQALGKLDTRAGNVARSAANLRAINGIRREFLAAQNSPIYSQMTRQLASEFSESAKILDGYFAAVSEAYSTPQALYKAITDEYIAATVSELQFGALGNLESQVTQILRTNLSAGANLQTLRNQVSKPFIGDKLLTSRAEALVDDALNQFSRNYTQAVSDDLGLVHYFYRGTIIKTSRDFCREKVGNYYTLDEVLSWANSPFAGMIKGTNRANIMTNLGGNKCRHRLAPVSEELYLLKTGKSK
jgi:hypothetical protein